MLSFQGHGPPQKTEVSQEVDSERAPAKYGSTDKSPGPSARAEELTEAKLAKSAGQPSTNAVDSDSISLSWYKSSWQTHGRSKTVTQVAKESISTAAGAASERIVPANFSPLQGEPLIPKRKLDTECRPTSFIASLRSLASANTQPPHASMKEDGNANNGAVPQRLAKSPSALVEDGTTRNDQISKQSVPFNAPAERDGWFSWVFPRNGDVVVERGSSTTPGLSEDSSGQKRLSEDSSGQKKRREGSTLSSKAVISQALAGNTEIDTHHECSTEGNPSSGSAGRKSWLGMWDTKSARPMTKDGTRSSTTPENPALGVRSNSAPFVAHSPAATASEAKKERKKTSAGWNFWSRGDDLQSSPNTDGKAVAEQPASNQPVGRQPAQIAPAEIRAVRGPKQVLLQSLPASIGDSSRDCNDIRNKKGQNSSPEVPENARSATGSDLVLPSLQSTYHLTSKPGLLQQMSRWIPFTTMNAHHTRSLALINPPKPRRALALGVHGFFPGQIVRSFLGQPTGTSVKFADGAADAIHRWSQCHNYECAVQKVALEGEGKIAERIDLLWKLLLNWIDDIRKSDLIIVACHSQGVPVAIMLVAKLIHFGCLSPTSRIGICAMAGINLGPFIEYKSRWIGATALELFEFSRGNSKVSRDYFAALDTTLKFGVKISFVGSIDDQLVSLESATFGPLVHPNIYRAVYVNGKVHAPDFLTHVVGFALKLRNLGVSNHGLVRELSVPLAGSLYSGDGHSRIYTDSQVYELSVAFTLETSTIFRVAAQVPTGEPLGSSNPYILPFAMRGVLEEEFVRTSLHAEVYELIQEFDEWKPSTKILKDVKFRLEGVRSKL